MSKSHQVLEVRKNGAFIFSDTLLVDYKQQQLAPLLAEVNSSANQIEFLIRKYMYEDQRLLGQEKANLVDILHKLIRDLAAMYLRLYDNSHTSLFDKDIEVNAGKDGFIVKGKMNVNEVNTNFSIEAWNKQYLQHAMENLVNEFRKAALDKQITLEEKVTLTGLITALLVQSVQAFYLMRTGAVFK